MNFEAIIFDMDGLLVDSETVWMECEQTVLAKRGKQWDFHVQGHLIGMRIRDYMQPMIEGYGLEDDTPESLADDLITTMVGLILHKVVAKPGAHEMIAYVSERGLPCAIASSSPLAIINAIVDSQGWRDVLHIHASGEEVVHGKPAPDVYLLAAERIGVNPLRCLALEDSPNGARAAVAAGMTCYAVPDLAHTQPERFDGVTPHLFNSLHDVHQTLA
jgi:HAD superfamily hydrolase (TIGR01509 family)